MVNSFVCEWLKLKRSKMLWLIAAGALLPALLNFFIAYHRVGSTGILQWSTLFHDELMLMTLLMSPSLFALFAGYILAREYQERTVNTFLTAPRARLELLFAKYAIMIPVIFATLALSYLLTLLSGLLLKHEALTAALLGKYALKFALLLVMQFALISLSITASMIGKSYVPAMGVGIFALLSSFVIMQSEYIMYDPWSAALNLLLDLNPANNDTATGVAVLVAAFVIPLIFNMAYFRKMDVHSG